MEIERITGSTTVPSPGPRRLKNGLPKDHATIAERHTELRSKLPYPESYRMTTEKQTEFY
jgi:hypothetical protein